MKKLIISILITGMLIFGMSMGVMADTTTDSTTVSIGVDAIATLLVTDAATGFTIKVPTTPGDAPDVSGADTSTTLAYTSVVTTGAYNHITASMDGVIPGLTLNIACGTIDTTGNGTPTSFDLTGTEAQNFVTAIGSGYATGVQITYGLTISDINSVVADTSTSNDRVVTFTIIAGTS